MEALWPRTKSSSRMAVCGSRASARMRRLRSDPSIIGCGRPSVYSSEPISTTVCSMLRFESQACLSHPAVHSNAPESLHLAGSAGTGSRMCRRRTGRAGTSALCSSSWARELPIRRCSHRPVLSFLRLPRPLPPAQVRQPRRSWRQLLWGACHSLLSGRTPRKHPITGLVQVLNRSIRAASVLVPGGLEMTTITLVPGRVRRHPGPQER